MLKFCSLFRMRVNNIAKYKTTNIINIYMTFSKWSFSDELSPVFIFIFEGLRLYDHYSVHLVLLCREFC